MNYSQLYYETYLYCTPKVQQQRGEQCTRVMK